VLGETYFRMSPAAVENQQTEKMQTGAGKLKVQMSQTVQRRKNADRCKGVFHRNGNSCNSRRPLRVHLLRGGAKELGLSKGKRIKRARPDKKGGIPVGGVGGGKRNNLTNHQKGRWPWNLVKEKKEGIYA